MHAFNIFSKFVVQKMENTKYEKFNLLGSKILNYLH